MRVALLTGGGDCPGLNAVIYAAVKKGINHYGDEFIGFLNGWKGVLENQFIPLTLERHRNSPLLTRVGNQHTIVRWLCSLATCRRCPASTRQS